MHRIDASGATVQNLFTDGDPAQGTPATVVDAKWLNMVQEEICNFIEEVGLELDDQDQTQLQTALFQLVAAGGGGGGSATWHAPDGLAPELVEAHGEKTYSFEKGTDNKLVLWIKVPQGYVTGRQIKMFLSWYSPSSSNGVLFRTTTYLIRKNNDAVTSTANSYTSTNTEVTNTVANQYREIEVALTDAEGKVNSVAVAAGAMLRVELKRVADTDTAAARFIPSGTEIKFG